MAAQFASTPGKKVSVMTVAHHTLRGDSSLAKKVFAHAMSLQTFESVEFSEFSGFCFWNFEVQQ